MRRYPPRAWALALLASALAVAPATAGPCDPTRDAALRTYIHGMTDEIARTEVGPGGVGCLLELLRDPEFPRRDNVVAFLAYLGGPETSPRLLGFVEHPPQPIEEPAEERALLIVPEALARIAARGDEAALDALINMTGPPGTAGPIETVRRRGTREASIARDLRGLAVRALAFAGAIPGAQARLQALGEGHEGESAAAAARGGLELLRELEGDEPDTPGPVPTSGGTVLGPDSPPPPTPVAPAVIQDTNGSSHENGLTYANHVAVNQPMTDVRLDDLLAEASRRAARGDWDDDTACCITVARSATARSFGAADDGLDVIETQAELNSVLGNPVARIKVVRSIQYCGGTGTNIIGCGYQPGHGVALVRMSSAAYESILWLHEYGHNTGLVHRGDSRYVMYGTNYGSNNLLETAECSRFHTPSSATQAILTDIGVCVDDGDPLASPIDNCPAAFNPDQSDLDGDGVGDVCDTCSDGGTIDTDGDGVCAPFDNCPTTPNPTQADFDGDGHGDACEAGATLADIDGSGRVDGTDLGRLGRSFGSTSGADLRYDPNSDLDRDGDVDGSDLAVLAAQFGGSVAG